MKKFFSWFENIPLWIIVSGSILIAGALKIIFTWIYLLFVDKIVPFFSNFDLSATYKSIISSDFFDSFLFFGFPFILMFLLVKVVRFIMEDFING